MLWKFTECGRFMNRPYIFGYDNSREGERCERCLWQNKRAERVAAAALPRAAGGR